MQFPGRGANGRSAVGLMLTSMVLLRKDKPITGSTREDFMKQLIKDYLDQGISGPQRQWAIRCRLDANEHGIVAKRQADNRLYAGGFHEATDQGLPRSGNFRAAAPMGDPL